MYIYVYIYIRSLVRLSTLLPFVRGLILCLLSPIAHQLGIDSLSLRPCI